MSKSILMRGNQNYRDCLKILIDRIFVSLLAVIIFRYDEISCDYRSKIANMNIEKNEY